LFEYVYIGKLFLKLIKADFKEIIICIENEGIFSLLYLYNNGIKFEIAFESVFEQTI
jgi:hypothetical protein